MLQNLLIPIGIMVVLSLLGWLTQMLKNAQLKQEAERERQRRESMPVAQPTGRGNANASSNSGAKAPASDIDRFLAEIDRLRQKGGTPAPPKATAKPAPVPTVVPVKKQRLADAPQPAPFVTTAAPPQGSSRSAPINRDDLPVATVVGPAPASAAAPRPQPTGTSPPTVTRPPAKVRAAVGSSVTRTAVVQTPFGQQLAALLTSPQSVPMAVVLAEILGEPKCKRGRS